MNGTKIQLDWEVVIPFVMDGCRLDTEALVSPDIEETRIGSKWMHAHRCLWDFYGSQLYIDGQPAAMLKQRRNLRCRRLYADQDTVVPASQQIEVPTRTTLLSAHAPAGDVIVETRQVQPGVYLGRTLLPLQHRDLRINVVNTTAEPKTVAAEEWLGNLQQVEVLSDLHETTPAAAAPAAGADMAPASSPANTDVVSTLMRQLPDDMDTGQHRQVSQLLYEYQDIFSTSAYDMGRTDLVEHEMNTGDHRPVRQGLRRHPIAHLDIIDEQVREMVRHDQGCSGAGTRRNAVPANVFGAERRSGKCC